MKKLFTILLLSSLVMGAATAQKVFVFDMTGTWCGFCPDAGIILHQLEADYPETFIGMGVHNSDDMEIPEGALMDNFFQVSSYPGGMVDQVLFPGQTKVSVSRSSWASLVAQRLNETRPLDIEIHSAVIDNTTDEIYVKATIHVTGTGFDRNSARVHLMLTEDDVVVPSDPQINYYSSQSSGAGGPNHPYYNEPASWADYVHDDVLRAAPTSASGLGQANVLKNSLTDIGVQWTFDAPTNAAGGLNTDNLRAVVMVTEYNPTDPNQDGNAVLNGNDLHIVKYDKGNINHPNHPENPSNWVTGINSIDAADVEVSVYPNPVSELGIINFTLPQNENVTVDLYNMLGQKVQAIKSGFMAAGVQQTAAIDAANLTEGVYLLKVTAGETSITERVVIAK